MLAAPVIGKVLPGFLAPSNAGRVTVDMVDQIVMFQPSALSGVLILSDLQRELLKVNSIHRVDGRTILSVTRGF